MNSSKLAQLLRGKWQGSLGPDTPLGTLFAYKLARRRALHIDPRCVRMPRLLDGSTRLELRFDDVKPGRLCEHCSSDLAGLLMASREPSDRTKERFVVVEGPCQPWLHRGAVRATMLDGRGLDRPSRPDHLAVVVLSDAVYRTLSGLTPAYVLGSCPRVEAWDDPNICELALGLWEPPWGTPSELSDLGAAFESARALVGKTCV
jgi:hypothetical protein